MADAPWLVALLANAEGAVAAAIEKRDLEGAVAIIQVLATREPKRAQAILDTIDLGMTLNRAGS